MYILLTVFGTFLPSLLLLRYFYKKDLHPEPTEVLIGTFLYGFLIIIPLIFMNGFLGWLEPHNAGPMFSGFFTAFVMAAFPEELFKYLVLTRYSARNPAFDEPMDGVVYGVTASLGFATLENILYVANGGLGVAITRAITAVPSHACLGAIMGYYVGQARFNRQSSPPANRGLVIAIILHGLYDFPLMAAHKISELAESGDPAAAAACLSESFLLLLFVGVVVFEFAWTVKIVRRLRREQLSLTKAS